MMVPQFENPLTDGFHPKKNMVYLKEFVRVFKSKKQTHMIMPVHDDQVSPTIELHHFMKRGDIMHHLAMSMVS